jgi:conjugal transfer/entry exclusion protein
MSHQYHNQNRARQGRQSHQLRSALARDARRDAMPTREEAAASPLLKSLVSHAERRKGTRRGRR